MKGIIRFDSKPEDVNIFINENYIGKTPLDIVDANIGVYQYVLKSNSNEFSGELTVYQGRITHISVNFILNETTKEYIDMKSLQFLDKEKEKTSPQTQLPQTKTAQNQETPAEERSVHYNTSYVVMTINKAV